MRPDIKSSGHPEPAAAGVGTVDGLERFGLVAWGEIEALTPSLNSILGLHFGELTKIKRDWDWRARLAFDRYEIPRAEKGEARGLRIVSRRRRLLDPDNFAGGLKFLIDGLVDAGLLSGDDELVLYSDIRQKKVRTKREEKTVLGLYFGEVEARGR